MSVGYYANWVLYDPQDYFVTNITAKDYSHLQYAFANVDANNGTVYLGDEYADLQYEYPGDDEDESGNNVYGNLKQLFLLKEHNRDLKIVLSIGGGSYSGNFENITSASWRQTFANSSAALLSDLGFDGLDIDYAEQAEATVELLAAVRQQLDIAAEKNGAEHYSLSWAANCGDYWDWLDVPGMDASLDYWNLMAYDFSGSWTDLALPASNLYHDGNPANFVNASGQQCAEHYQNAGVNSRKLVLGMPLYGTAFNGTQGMYTNYTDLGGGDWGEDGDYDVKHLPLTGEVMFYNKTLGAAWSYNNSTGHIVSFDTPTVALQKAKYVMSANLGGMMYWEIDGDYSKLQAAGKPSGPVRPGHWNPSKGETKRKSYGRHKGAPWPSDSGEQQALDQRDFIPRAPAPAPAAAGSSMIMAKRYKVVERDALVISTNDQSGWKLQTDDSICLNIGESLVDVVVTAFEKYGGGLDRTRNSLSYPYSQYDNIRNATGY